MKTEAEILEWLAVKENQRLRCQLSGWSADAMDVMDAEIEILQKVLGE